MPVPVAVGISDEHRLKLFRIVAQLDRATLFTEMGLLERLLEFSKQRELDDITALLESRTVAHDRCSAGGAWRGVRGDAG